MSETTKPATIDLGEIDAAIELVFTDGADDRRYVLQPAGNQPDYLDTMKRFPAHQVKRTTEYYIDDTAGQWFACYVVDCFDPPMAIVRARTFEDAYEVFCDEWERWMAVDAADAADYPEEDRNYNGNGTHIDTDNVHIQPLQLITVTLAGGAL